MKKLLRYTFIFIITLFVYNCSSKDDDDCIKTITIPQFYIVNNQTYRYDIMQEVPCDFPEIEDPKLIEPPILESFTYEILSFNFTPDTGNNTSRLQFEIKVNNNSDVAVEGVPILTLVSDGLEFSGSYSADASIPCFGINANSSCILTYNKEASLDLGIVNSIQLTNVQYYLTN